MRRTNVITVTRPRRMSGAGYQPRMLEMRNFYEIKSEHLNRRLLEKPNLTQTDTTEMDLKEFGIRIWTRFTCLIWSRLRMMCKMWHVDLLLGNDLEISKNTTTVTK
jgi:hypothetical protein